MALHISKIGNQKTAMRIREIDKIELECEGIECGDIGINQRYN
jgi:hypothetical protein